MRPTDGIKKFFKNAAIDTNSTVDEIVLGEILNAHDKAMNTKSAANKLNINIRRMIMKSRIMKLAVAAVIIIAVLTGIHHFGSSVEVANVAWADVLDQIYKARSVTYKQTFYLGEKQEFTTENMIIESGLMRSVLPHGDITIWDFANGKRLDLMPHFKRAILTQDIGRRRGKKPFNYLEWVSKVHEQDTEFERQEEIDGKIGDVFVAQKEFEKTTVWVDPRTDLPIRVERVFVQNPDKNIIVPEMSLSLMDFGGSGNESSSIIIGGGWGIQKEMTIVWGDFVWNAEPDESLFSLEPPEGYTLEEKQFDQSQPDEKHLIEALAFWTEMSNGSFPSAINELGDPNLVRPMLFEKFDRDGEPREELDQAMKKMNVILKALYFAQVLKVEGNWHYAGNGVMLGDAETAIFWYRPEGSETYRVIYGDLSVGDVTPENLPE